MKVFRRTIRGRKSRAWYVKFWVGGRQVLKSTGCTTEREAQKWARKHVEDLRRQQSVVALTEKLLQLRSGGQPIPLTEAFDRFLKVPKKRKAGTKYINQTRGYWDDFTAFAADTIRKDATLSDVTLSHADKYIDHVRRSGRWNKNISYKRPRKRSAITYKTEDEHFSVKTSNQYLGTLKQVFEALKRDAGLVKNPFSHIPKLQSDEEPRETFTQDELRLINNKIDDFLRPLFMIALHTGLREGDACTLRSSQVDMAGEWITLNMRKTKKPVRIPIMTALRDELLKYPMNGVYVLPDHAEMYLHNPDGINYRFGNFLESIGITTTRQVEGRSRKVSVVATT